MKKYISSSSEEDLHFYQDKENRITRGKILPAFPQKKHFMSSNKQLSDTSMQNIGNILREKIFFNAVSNNGKH